MDARCGSIGRLSKCFEDRRDLARIEHSVGHLLAQRINGLAMGYEDLNDLDALTAGNSFSIVVTPTSAIFTGKHLFSGL